MDEHKILCIQGVLQYDESGHVMNKIPVIKLIRAYEKGLGLKEAKDLVELAEALDTDKHFRVRRRVG